MGSCDEGRAMYITDCTYNAYMIIKTMKLTVGHHLIQGFPFLIIPLADSTTHCIFVTGLE